MKSLARPSFFRMFDLLLNTTNSGLKRSRWTYEGVEFEYERHSFHRPKTWPDNQRVHLDAARPPRLEPDGNEGILVGRRGQQTIQRSAMGAPCKRAKKRSDGMVESPRSCVGADIRDSSRLIAA